MRRRSTGLLVIAAFLLATSPASGASPASGSGPAAGAVPPTRLVRVPEDVATPEAAIALAEPGDVIVLAAGTYSGGLVVPEAVHDITIRGVDRNRVVFDGRGLDQTAIEIEGDRVTLENLSAHDFGINGFYWEQVDGFTGRYLTVWNVNLYGIYATESRAGVFEHSLASGAADAAFYIGECQPCDVVVRDVEGRLSAVGFSGTNTGAGLDIVDSTWDRNGTGILPNSYEELALPPPESQSRIDGNTITASGSVPVPAHSELAGFIGLGIGVAGGNANTITNNAITGSARYGIAFFPTIQRSGTVLAASGNRVEGNRVSGSGTADLAVAPMLGPAGDPNCFAGNTVGTTLPADLASVQACGAAIATAGDAAVGADLAIPAPEAIARLRDLPPRPDYRSMPVPEPQPTSPDPLPAGLRPFREPGPSPVLTGGLVVAVVAAAAVLWLVGRGRRRGRSA